MSNNIEKLVESYSSQEFNEINLKLREHFELAHDEIEKAQVFVNELVVIVHNDNPEWSLKRICNYIAGRNIDLEQYGLSARTIHNYLNEENRQLIDTQKQRIKQEQHQPSSELEKLRQEKGELLQNNVMDQSGESLHQKVIEESSISTTTSTADLAGEEEGEEEIIYDSIFVNNLIKENQELKKANRELLEENAKLYRELEKWKKQKT